MPFLQLTLDVGARHPEPYEDALFALGALSVSLFDAADDPVLEPAPGATPLWPTVVISAMFAADADVAGIRTALGATPGLDPLLVAEKSRVVTVVDRVWEREWLHDFRPMRFGKRLWVCPGGQLPPSPPAPADSSATDDGALRLEPIVTLELDPGLAFGTGTHVTTAMCLEWLDSGADSWLHAADVIDYGCGSGILALAALKLGAGAAVAMDIDPQARLAARENAQRNGLADRVRISGDPDCDQADANVLVANILAGPLVELAPLLGRRVRVGGRLALSGLLLDQVDAVTAAYLPWFDIDLAGARDGWGLLAGSRHADPHT